MARPAPKHRKYEMMIVVAPTVTEDGLPAVVERVTALIEAQEGSIESLTHDSPWGHRRLAYPIQNFRDAFYVLFYFHSAPRVITELERDLRLDEAVIRHLIVKFDPLTVREVEGESETGGEAPPAPAPVAPPVEESSDAAGTDDAVVADDTAGTDDPVAAADVADTGEGDAGEESASEPESSDSAEEDDDGGDDSDDGEDGAEAAEADEAEAPSDGEDEDKNE